MRIACYNEFYPCGIATRHRIAYDMCNGISTRHFVAMCNANARVEFIIPRKPFVIRNGTCRITLTI